ncbi:MAG: hypothetical protein HZB53_01220 [Chloroflexi bacterium]|nr:hypothetical protein [Chloroflexota bacterium]
MTTPLSVPFDLARLCDAFEQSSGALSFYLDVESGAIERIGEETRRILYGLQEMYGADDGTLDIELALSRRDLGARVKDDLRAAHRIEAGFGARYRKVPESDSMDGYADMKTFAESSDAALRERLWRAMQGTGARARFEAILRDAPAEAARWQAYRAGRMQARVNAWLAEEGIEAAG